MDARGSKTDFNFADWTRIWAQSSVDLAVFALTPRGIVASWNPGSTLIYQYETEEIVGCHYSELFPPEARDPQTFEAEFEGAQARGSYAIEGWRRRKDGSHFWASVVTTAIHDAEGSLAGFLKVVRDETEKRQAHDAVIESERNFRLLVQGVTDYAIFMLSPEGKVSSWNQGAERIKGYTAEQILGSHFSRFYVPDDVVSGVPEKALSTAASEGRFEAEGWRVRRDGTRFRAHVVIDAIKDEAGTLIGFAKITRDVTERREAQRTLEQTQAALFQSQKMEAIGKLTGGVAHDFNNVLQVLRGNLELINARQPRDEWLTTRLFNALEAVDRGAKLASQLLAFGRRQALRPVPVNLGDMIRSTDDLLRRALGETISVETVVSGDLWNAMVDTHQLENVLLNLAINARDAMPDGGTLTLELSNAMLDDGYVRPLSDVPAGQYVMLGVTDTGTGMKPEVLERAFDPFFTTKPEGAGSGLGLSMAYGFVKQSGGHIRIYSELDHGTTVRIYLPNSSAEAYEPVKRASAKLMGGPETVLVVEDDAKVQTTVIEMLSGLGYSVLRADNADQALVVLGSGVHIDLLFTDVVMPGSLKSPEMARQALELQPHLKVLFTSGYTQNAIVHAGRLDEGVELLSKPYSRAELASKIRHVLGSPGQMLAQPSAISEAQRHGTVTTLEIIVVEDNQSAREAVCELLLMLGHHVVQAETATQAFAEMAQRRFNVLMTDINLPDMSGLDVAQQASSFCPGLSVIFASGEPVANDETRAFAWFQLLKPYTFDDLQTVLQKVMDEANGRPAVDTQ
ncbi:sensor kinase/response regulator fusion protein [Caballeronia fortuita]|uniref:histidine kinase n=1 Tax=Caballeronia fortuita TaxID=1777138 RepID=A0A158CPP3_9BURK|nr:PAS domain S-box protein [Caballeronia fortuita]SAK83587.1 sensor kinase/response regulator fusion protein [Caballeronia fortuita]